MSNSIPSSPPKGPAILYLDDEEKSLKYFRRLFESEYCVYVADNAGKAKQILDEKHDQIGVLLCDQRMPDMDGVQFLEFAKQRHPGVVRIMTTAYAAMDSALSAVNRGEVYRFILKPWKLQELRMEVLHGMQTHLQLKHQGELLQARRRTMLSLASQIAHELRTPLAAIRSAAGNLSAYWPELIHAYQATDNNTSLPSSALNDLAKTPEQIQSIVDRANLMINLQLMNARENALPENTQECCSIKNCIETSLSSFPFRTGEREYISMEGDDFQFFGSDVLTNFLIYNLLQNSLDAIRMNGQGTIRIQMQPSNDMNQLFFHDTGGGMKPEVAEKAFDEFFSNKPKGHGTGMGLAFCRRVMHSFKGDIFCQSEFGSHTVFSLHFPSIDTVGKPAP